MDYILDTHTHTLASGHAYNTILEMAQAAAKKGLKFLGITDHAKMMPESCGDFYFNNLKVVPREMFGIQIGLGVELNICDYNGHVDMSRDLLEKMDVTIASFHTPCIDPATKELHTQALLQVLQNPYINIIGHPDDGRYLVDYNAIVKGAKEHHKLLELNNNSLNPKGFRLNTRENDAEMLRKCMEYDQPVIIGSDAHWMDDIARHDFADEVIEEVGFPKRLIVNYDLDLFYSYCPKLRK